MDRVVLQSKENNSCESQSPLKNINISAGLISEEKHDNSKENFNPKSLSEIASDTSSKLPPKVEVSNSTSTPKPSKKDQIKKLDSSDLELDSTLDILPNYPRQQLAVDKPDVNLSFLTNGLNNLGLESSGDCESRNATFSDDEEMFVECRSFSDLSNRSAVVEETNLNTTVNVEQNKNDTLTETANATFDANSTEILATDGNATFECDDVSKQNVEEKSIKNETPVLLESNGDNEELDKTPTNIEVEEPVTVEKVIKSPELKEEVQNTQEPASEEASFTVAEISHPDLDACGQFTDSPTQVETQPLPVPVEAPKEDLTEPEPLPQEPEIVYRNIDERVSYEHEDEPLDYKNYPDVPSISQTEIPEAIPQSTESELAKPKSPEIKKLNENVFVNKMESQFDVEFKMPSAPVFKQPNDGYSNEEFSACGSSYSFGESDLDYLQGFGSAKQRQSTFERDSLLLKFDPLLNKPVQVNTTILATTREEDDYVADFELKIPELPQDPSPNSSLECNREHSKEQLSQLNNEMSISVDIMKDINIENKTSELNEEIKLSSHHNEENGNNLKMAEAKKEADMREETLLKRISEKDKQIAKMNGVVEAYEKAISELIAEKEQIVLSYEKKCQDLKHDSEQNAHHLASLETTFSDLHAKYERTKQVALELKDREESILQDRKTLTENLKMQEVRYDKMKSHAMAQLEIANTSLADMNRNHHADVTKLKAQLKKEEISRASVNEQLIQKSKENSELVKICDELINGTQSS